jgi:hypothetical protein
MDEKAQACQEIAVMQDTMYDCRHTVVILVMMHSDDLIRLSKYHRLWGGKIHGWGDPDSKYEDRRNPVNMSRGQYKWQLQGEEAYHFCLDILPYLGRLDPYRHHWCQQCITTHRGRAA